jgi:hypothetical protein
VTFPTPNHDEASVQKDRPYIGNFHKTLPHNKYGEVDPASYRKFKGTCLAIDAGAPINFEEVPSGSLNDVDANGTLITPPFDPRINGLPDVVSRKSPAKFTSPMAGAASEGLGPDPKVMNMPPAPGLLSASAAAEMTELYWMALLRDVPLLAFQAPANGKAAKDACNVVPAKERALVDEAVCELHKRFGEALDADANTPGGLRLVQDLASKQSACDYHCKHPPGGHLDLSLSTLFRSGLRDENHGPIISQFFLRDIPYGVQTINVKQVPYIAEKNFLTQHNDWLRAQIMGKDRFGRDYANCNNLADQVAFGETYFADKPRSISTMRDMARFVNRDALHQAYFNAALFLDNIGAPLDAGNPYAGNLYSREGGFASLGGPDLLTLVSEVASRALKVVWRQKWLVHRRCRPEVYGGLLQMQALGLDGNSTDRRAYGLPDWAATSDAATKVKALNKLHGQETLFLPMAFSAGSPAHPAYGAGHATVAGACVTALKAWFDEDAKLGSTIAKAQASRKDPGDLAGLLQPGARMNGEDFCEPQPYMGDDAEKITVGGELNKLASNVAMGRSMGGVHWRTDNTRSLRLGEQIAIEILRKRSAEYAERPVLFSFRSFDGQWVMISRGQVSVG